MNKPLPEYSERKTKLIWFSVMILMPIIAVAINLIGFFYLSQENPESRVEEVLSQHTQKEQDQGKKEKMSEEEEQTL